MEKEKSGGTDAVLMLQPFDGVQRFVRFLTLLGGPKNRRRRDALTEVVSGSVKKCKPTVFMKLIWILSTFLR